MKILCLLFLIFALYSNAAADRNYWIPKVEIIAEVQDDGAIMYTEHRTYRFRGSFSEGEYILPTNGFDTVDNIEVWEGDRKYERMHIEREWNYNVVSRGNYIHINWFFSTFGTHNERTFTIRYHLQGAIAVGELHAEWFWNFVDGRAWRKTTDEVTITVVFPDAINENDMNIWARSVGNDFDIRYHENMVQLTGGPINSRQYAEFRLVFPKNLIPRSDVTHPEFTLGLVEAQEQKYLAEQAMREMRAENRKETATFLAYILTGLAILLMLYSYLRYRPIRDRSLREEFKYEPPKIHPVMADWLLNGRFTTATGQTAAIFNLARMGYLNIRESSDVVKGTKNKDMVLEPGKNENSDALPEWDKSLLDHILTTIRNGNSKLSSLFQMDKKPNWEWSAHWKRIVKEEGKSRHWYNHENYSSMILMMLMHILILLASIYVIVHTWIGLLPAFIAVVGIIGSYGIIHLTAEGYELYHHIKAYRKALKEKSPDHFNREDVAQHFIFSILFGLNEKVMQRQLKNVGSNDFPWLMMSTTTIYSMGRYSSAIASVSYSSSGSISGSGASIGSSGGGAGGGMR